MNDSCNDVARRKRASLLGRSLGGVAGVSPSEFGLALAMFEVRPYSTSSFASSSSVPSADLVLYETERASRGRGVECDIWWMQGKCRHGLALPRPPAKLRSQDVSEAGSDYLC